VVASIVAHTLKTCVGKSLVGVLLGKSSVEFSELSSDGVLRCGDELVQEELRILGIALVALGQTVAVSKPDMVEGAGVVGV
jgi:hypothetical protein